MLNSELAQGDRGVPGAAVTDHGIEDCQELSHAGGLGDATGLPLCSWAFVEDADHRVPTGGAEHAHEERGTYRCPATPDHAFAAELAAVARPGSDADKGRDLLVSQRSEFREFGDQRSRERLGPTPGTVWSRSLLAAQTGLFRIRASRSASTSARGKGPDLGPNPGREQCEAQGINGIGLGELAGATGEVPGLARIGDDDRDLDGCQGHSGWHFNTTGGFENDEGGSKLQEFGDKRLNPVLVIGQPPHIVAAVDSPVQMSFGDINSDEDRVVLVHLDLPGSRGCGHRLSILHDAGSEALATVRDLVTAEMARRPG